MPTVYLSFRKVPPWASSFPVSSCLFFFVASGLFLMNTPSNFNLHIPSPTLSYSEVKNWSSSSQSTFNSSPSIETLSQYDLLPLEAQRKDDIIHPSSPCNPNIYQDDEGEALSCMHFLSQLAPQKNSFLLCSSYNLPGYFCGTLDFYADSVPTPLRFSPIFVALLCPWKSVNGVFVWGQKSSHLTLGTKDISEPSWEWMASNKLLPGDAGRNAFASKTFHTNQVSYFIWEARTSCALTKTTTP